jgi:F420H(2)-dependent quinone reductase
MARLRSRFSVPRGLIAGTLAATALVWGLDAISPGASLRSALVQSGVYLGLLLLTICSRRAKVLLVRTVQRYTRRVPVGNGRKGDSFWIIAEHGSRAGYVRNIQHDPHVRVRLRIGLRYRWVPGIATVCPGDDPLARQRQIIAWHPLRTLNAINVRVLGADLLTVSVRAGSVPRACRSPPRCRVGRRRS